MTWLNQKVKAQSKRAEAIPMISDLIIKYFWGFGVLGKLRIFNPLLFLLHFETLNL